jgi:hypothetical protein
MEREVANKKYILLLNPNSVKRKRAHQPTLVGICSTLVEVQWRQEYVKTVHQGKFEIRHRKRHPLRKVPLECGRGTALFGRFGRFGLSPQIEVPIRWVRRSGGEVGEIGGEVSNVIIGGEVSNVIIGGLAPSRDVLFLEILFLLTPPHLLKLEKKGKTIQTWSD